MAERPDELHDYADYEAERHKLGEQLSARLEAELAHKPIPARRKPMRLLYVTFPLAAAALVAAALAPSLLGPREAGPVVVEVTQAPVPVEPPVVQGQGLTVHASLDRGVLLQGAGEERFLVVELGAGQAAAGSPVHLAAVVDTSGSMAGDRKLEYAKQALLTLAGQLGPEDTLSIVGFDSEARVWLPAGPVEQPRVLEAVSSLSPSGGTRIGAGLLLGLVELAKVQHSGAKRVVVLSDGISDEDRSYLAALATSQVEQGVTVSALGLGLDFDSRALIAISDAGGGSYRYVDRPEGLATMFADELGTLTRLASRGVSVEVQLADGVQVQQVYGYGEHDGQMTAHGYRAFVGDMHAGQQRKVVARVRVPDGTPGDRAVASIRVSYTPSQGERQVEALEVRARVSPDVEEVAASVQMRAGLLAAHAVQGDTLQRSQDGWSSGDRAAVARAWEEGDEVLSQLEDQLGDEVAELRTRLEADRQVFETLEPEAPGAAPVRLQMELRALETME
jgi:Ca-activated chloride channel family protein